MLALLLAPLRADAASVPSTDVSATPCTAASVSAVADAAADSYAAGAVTCAAVTGTAAATTGAAVTAAGAVAATQPYFDRATPKPKLLKRMKAAHVASAIPGILKIQLSQNLHVTVHTVQQSFVKSMSS